MSLLSLPRRYRQTVFSVSSLCLACSGASAFGQGMPSANDGFDPNVTGSVYAIAVQTDGKLILGGNFSAVQPNGTVNPTPVNGLVRTNIDGSLDVVFPIAPNGTVAAQVNLAALQSNGDILVAGSFTTAQSGISNLARFTPQGTLDTTFKVVLGGAFGPNSAGITALAVQPNGKILIGGNFISVQGTGATGHPQPHCPAELGRQFGCGVQSQCQRPGRRLCPHPRRSHLDRRGLHQPAAQWFDHRLAAQPPRVAQFRRKHQRRVRLLWQLCQRIQSKLK